MGLWLGSVDRGFLSVWIERQASNGLNAFFQYGWLEQRCGDSLLSIVEIYDA
jgi:hypothetical protein